MKIRPATYDDIPAMAELVYQLNQFHNEEVKPTPQDYHDNWEGFNAYVAEDDNGDLIGFLSGYDCYQFHTAIKRFEIQNLFVAEQARRQGVAKKLIDDVIARKRKQGVTQFTLGVLEFNKDAIKFYEAYGLEQSTTPARRYRLSFSD